MTLFYILLATLIISTISILCAVILSSSSKTLNKSVFYLVAFSTGTLLGSAFFNLIPESLKNQDFEKVSVYLVIAFTFFFVIEKLLHWHHCHEQDCTVTSIGYMNLFGDAIHNFIDGLIIAASFIVDTRLGVLTSFALVFHEIPQELGDFSVLLYSGMEKKKALLYNFLVGLTAVLGGVVGYAFFEKSQGLVNMLLPFAAGSFLYISTSDLIPELKRENNFKRSVGSFLLFLAGLVLMYFFAKLE